MLVTISKKLIGQYSKLSEGYLQFAESISTKVVWQENLLEAKSPLDYFECIVGKDSRALEDLEEAALGEGLAPKVDKTQEYQEMFSELSSDDKFSNSQYLELAHFLGLQIKKLISEITTNYASRSTQLGRVSQGLLNTLVRFPEQYHELKRRVGVANSNRLFIDCFTQTFSDRGFQLVDHLFYFFEIFQKTLRETVLDNLVIWDKEYTMAMNKILSKFEEQAVLLQTKLILLEKIQNTCKQPEPLAPEQKKSIIEKFEEVQLEMSKSCLLIVAESTKSVKFSFEFLEKTLNSLIKVYDALSQHSELTFEVKHEAETSKADEKDQPIDPEAVWEFFQLDADMVGAFRTAIQVPVESQLVFEPVIDKKTLYTALQSIFGIWMEGVLPCLQPIHQLPQILGQIKTMKESGLEQKNALMSPEMIFMVEKSDEDINMASSHKYSARVNKGSLPHTGTLMIMSEYFIFFSKSLSGSMNMLVPFKLITEVKTCRNFLGMNNGFVVVTVAGPIEMFVSDQTERQKIVSAIQLGVDSTKIALGTELSRVLSFRDSFWWPDASQQPQTKVSELSVDFDYWDLCKVNFNRKHRIFKVRYLDHSNAYFSELIPAAFVLEIVKFLFSETSFSLRETHESSFLAYFHGSKGASEFTLQKKPSFAEEIFTSKELSAEQLVKAVLDESEPRTVISTFTMPDVGLVTEKLLVHVLYPDLVAVEIQTTTAKKTEAFEGLLLLTQGRFSDRTADKDSVQCCVYKRQGTTFKGANELYGEDLLKAMVEVANKRAFTGADLSGTSISEEQTKTITSN